ncbi:MAG: single-stranded DNA-binding protein [Staphylococcus equorum]|nr:single-stranded DNA-binding protein [Tetragenococcus koreensis]MDN6612136.1 single-stranded DNA-binding protein [Staphylococcus equorum]
MNNNNYIGNICTDIKLHGENNNVAKFMIAVRRNFKNKQTDKYESDFIPMIAFGKTAEIIANNFEKGKQIGITGRYQSGSYENNEGKKIYTHDIVVNDITFVGSKNSGTNNQQSSNISSGQNNPFDNGDLSNMEDQLPF